MPQAAGPEKSKTSRSRRIRLIYVFVLAAVLVVFILQGNRDPTRQTDLGRLVKSGQAKGFNLLLITLDTTRQDRLGCYGYKQAQTPAIDSLVAHGVRFDDAVTSIPLTLPAHATILTGLAPPHHGVRDNGRYRLAPEHVTLARTLKAENYDTAAFVSCFVLDARFGLNEGFDLYDFKVGKEGFVDGSEEFNERPANEVTDATVQWLERRRQSGATAPFFAWVHYFDPHRPYQSPLSLRPEFLGRPYDAEISFMDQEFRRLLNTLDRLGLRERTLIALVCDHGESLGEHNEQEHGLLVYEAAMRVGFILSSPALFDRPYRVDERVVGLVDLRPTLEDLLGIPPSQPGDGQSLLAAQHDRRRAIYLETECGFYSGAMSPLYGLRRHGDKYILAPQPEYYDLAKDPHELKNLYTAKPSESSVLAEQLDRLMRDWKVRDLAGRRSRILNDEEIRRLASLGYVHGQTTQPAGGEDLPDPKVMLPRFNKLMEAMDLHYQKRNTEALPMALAAMEGWDRFAIGQRMLAGIYIALGRKDEAAAVLRKSIKTNPEFLTYRFLAEIMMERASFAEAEKVLEQARQLSPDDGRVPLLVGDLRFRQGRLREAMELYRKAIQMDEHRVGIPGRQRILETAELLRQEKPTSNVP